MQEGNVQTIGTLARSLVNEAYALLVTHGKSFAHTILHLECYMMNATSAVVQELLYGALGACGLQQFQFNLANLQEGSLYLLVFHHFGLVDIKSQYIAEIGQHGINALHGNAQVFNA